MASSLEFVQYAAGQLGEAGEISWKRMFGEYGLYCDGIFFAVICDNCLFVKLTVAGAAAFPQLPHQPPYEGARPYLLVEELDDREWLARLVRCTCAALPAPGARRRRSRM